MLYRVRPSTWGLRAQLLVSMLALTMLPLLIVSALSVMETSNALTENISADYRQQAAVRASRVAELIGEQIRLLQTKASSYHLYLAADFAGRQYPPDPDEARAYLRQLDEQWAVAADSDRLITRRTERLEADELRRFSQLLPNHVEVFLTDARGAIVVANRRTTDLDQSDEGWWQAAWNNGAGADHISQPLFDQSTGVRGLILAVPVFDPFTQRPVGILRSTFSMDAFDDLFAEYSGPDQPHMLLIASNDIVIASTDRSEVGKQIPAAFQPSDGAAMEAGRNYILATSPVPGFVNASAFDALSWRIVLAQDSDVALAPARRPIGSAVLVALLLALVTSGVALLIGTRVTRPINQLARVAQEGNLETLAAAPATYVQHEVGQLRASLGRLARSVLDSRQQIEAVNRGLEGAVAERTAELHAVVQRQEELLTTQNRLLQQIADMAMPVLPIRPGVIVLPLVGAIDGARADILAARLLRGIEKQRARVALIDITGVPLVDTQVAETLLQAIAGARLLGAQALLVGIRPEIAQTLVSLGVDLRDLETTATLQEGLARAQMLLAAYARR